MRNATYDAWHHAWSCLPLLDYHADFLPKLETADMLRRASAGCDASPRREEFSRVLHGGGERRHSGSRTSPLWLTKSFGAGAEPEAGAPPRRIKVKTVFARRQSPRLP
ncbi:MAG TPA: hypothetical protein VJR47_07085 [Stellaceae bacterium]|nr:hypothetical protein [Stellaceae bacterium]